MSKPLDEDDDLYPAQASDELRRAINDHELAQRHLISTVIDELSARVRVRYPEAWGLRLDGERSDRGDVVLAVVSVETVAGEVLDKPDFDRDGLEHDFNARELLRILVDNDDEWRYLHGLPDIMVLRSTRR